MVNYPATSSVAVQSARAHLNRVLKVYNSAGAAGKLAIAEQFTHFAYNDELSKHEHLFPTSAEPAAHAVRRDIAELARHMHRQGKAARIGIAEQCEAAVLSVGGALLPVVGASATPTAPAPDADGKVTLSLLDAVPTLANVFFVNWTIDSIPLSGTSGDRIRVTPKALPQLVWAEVWGMDGSNIAISWTVPAAVAVMEAGVAPATFAKDDIKGLSKAALLQLLTGEKTLDELTAAQE